MEKPWKVIAAFVGVFIFGSIFGGLLALRIQQRPAAVKRPAQGQNQPGPLPAILRLHAEQLDLTPEQREKIRPMVERAEEDIRRVRQTSLRETGIILKRLQEDFANELTPEQRRKLGKMQERMQERLREDRGALQPLRDKPAGKPRPGSPKDKEAAAKEESPAAMTPESASPGK
jgi:Spy/CpxP family protein refolding chaperone